MKSQPFRIGIAGGMGPQATVLLQQYIIEETPARCDQDHLEVVTFNNPHIPDRTMSLRTDGGKSMTAAIIDSVRLLEKADVSIVVIPCITAHARIEEIIKNTTVPVINIITATMDSVGSGEKIGLLATDGTLHERIFNSTGHSWIFPDPSTQKNTMKLIYAIKAGSLTVAEQGKGLQILLATMHALGATQIILGCTELSIANTHLQPTTYKTLDPLRIAARRLVTEAVAVRLVEPAFLSPVDNRSN